MGVQTIEKVFNENTTPTLTFPLLDGTSGISKSALTTITLTYCTMASGTIINNRDDQDVFDKNDVVIDSNGVVTWTLQADDSAIEDDEVEYEWVAALFRWTYNAGAKRGNEEFRFQKRNISKIP